MSDWIKSEKDTATNLATYRTVIAEDGRQSVDEGEGLRKRQFLAFIRL